MDGTTEGAARQSRQVQVGVFSQRDAAGRRALAVEAVQSSQEKNAPHRLHAPLHADLWRCQAAAGRAVIIEAPSMFQSRVTAVVRRLPTGLPFSEGLKLSAKMMRAIPPEQIGRMMSGMEAAELIVQLVQGRGRPRP